jgi:peptide deformylase
MQIVEINKIPTLDKIQDVPMDNPIEVLKVCQNLQILCEKENGIGISAVQAGIPWKLFLIKGDGTCPFIKKNEYMYFVNCNYEDTIGEKIISLEGCLSVRSPSGQLRSFQVERFKNIILKGYYLSIEKGLDLKELSENVSALEQGIVFQHEIDHQKSILISDIGKEVFIW